MLEEDGENFAEFRRSVGEEIMTDRLRQRIVSSMDPVSDTEVEILLASEDFSGGEYDISHIQVGLPDGANPSQVAEAETRIAEIHRQLEDGLDFSSAAISFSESQDALEGCAQIGAVLQLRPVPRLDAPLGLDRQESFA